MPLLFPRGFGVGAPSAPVQSGNLLLNPSVEEGSTTAATYWIGSGGGGSNKWNRTSGAQRTGSWGLRPSTGGAPVAYQDVGLGGYAQSIDAGTAKVNGSGWMKKTFQHVNYDNDRVRIYVQFFNASMVLVEPSSASAWAYGTLNVWVNVLLPTDHVIPATARTARFVIEGNSPATGRSIIIDVDDLDMKITT